MECLEAKALKSSFHWELAMKSAQQDVSEEAWYLNGANLVAVDDFEVDEFFNFSNGDFEHGSALRVEDDDEEDEFEKDGLSVSSEERLEDDGSSNSNQSGGFLAVEEDSKSLLAVELAIPGDALADLEWVSQFVDDSCSEFSLSCPAVKTQVETQAFMKKKRSEPERRLTGAGISCFLTSFPVRPRTKRPRQSRQARSTGSSLNQSPSSSSSSTSSGVSSAPQFIFTDAGENVDSSNASGEPPKKPRKKAALQGGGGSAGPTAQIPRRCSHCLVQKTPQWRTGPNGAKTLCNACGVRYKSGRLFPEYRPALSPTFCSGVHSNSHRKVLEMRKVKETPEPATELTPMVPSY